MPDPVFERRQRIVEALVIAGPDGVSGQQLAEVLGCSRAAVHRHVDALRTEGITIHGGHHGYVLDESADPVVAHVVQSSLRPPLAGPVLWSAETDSTNDDAARSAREGAPEGLVVGTDYQRMGRGRRGREWRADPRCALTFSVVLRPTVDPVDVGMLPLVMAIGVATAIGEDASIIWPNDVVVSGRKVCGILCESSLDESGVAWTVAGIGVNVHDSPDLDDARWAPGHVGQHRPVRRGELLVDLLNTVGDVYARWQSDGPEVIVTKYARRDALADTTVTVQRASDAISGVASGIDRLGRLRLSVNGVMRDLAAGEVTRIERASNGD